MRTPVFYAAIPILLGLCIPFSSFIYLSSILCVSVMLLGVVVFRSQINNILDKRASIGLVFGLSICAVFFFKTYYKWSTCEISKSVKGLPAREISVDLILKQIKLQRVGIYSWKKQYVGKITSAPIVRADLINKVVKLTGSKIQGDNTGERRHFTGKGNNKRRLFFFVLHK